MNNKESGMKAENHFILRLNKLGIPYEFIDDWYDFEVYGQKVELKSCRISIKDPAPKYNNQHYRIGRFDFTKEETREKQYDNNIWVCFIARHKEEFIMLGFCKARALDKKRYISIHKTRDLNLIDLEEWILKIQN